MVLRDYIYQWKVRCIIQNKMQIMNIAMYVPLISKTLNNFDMDHDA